VGLGTVLRDSVTEQKVRGQWENRTEPSSRFLLFFYKPGIGQRRSSRFIAACRGPISLHHLQLEISVVLR